MNSSVIIFPGSNCDRDMDVALKKFGFKNKMVWHDDEQLPKSDLIVLPGGFSYGDYLRCGSIAGKSKIIKSLWRIIYSNKDADMYETNLMRRLSGLLYIDSKTMGDIKNKIKAQNSQ